MYNYVVFHCSIDYCVELSLVDKTEIAVISEGNDFSLIPLGKCAFFRGELQIDAINSNFENFESALYNSFLISECAFKE